MTRENTPFKGVVSYAHKDMEVEGEELRSLLNWLEGFLSSKLGQTFTIWRDQRHLRCGEAWRNKISREIYSSNAFFILLSPFWLNSPECKQEYQEMLERERELGPAKRIFILQIHELLPKHENEHAEILADLGEHQAKRWQNLLDADSKEIKAASRAAAKEIISLLTEETAVPKRLTRAAPALLMPSGAPRVVAHKVTAKVDGTGAEPRLYSYVLRRDQGFSPNPFHGWCTLATCKPHIRASARLGDWVAGFRNGLLTFAMRVDEALGFDEYWHDARFHKKRPYLSGSNKQLCGDNIYHRGANGAWRQEDSLASLRNGLVSAQNTLYDTNVDRVLVSSQYYYFGRSAPLLPPSLADIIAKGRGHRVMHDGTAVNRLLDWLKYTYEQGQHSLPADFDLVTPAQAYAAATLPTRL